MYEHRPTCARAYDCGSPGMHCIHPSVGKVALRISDDRLRTICNTAAQVNCKGPSRVEQRSELKKH